MARLCIRITSNDHPTDAALTPLRTSEGDVVCLVDDGHRFSRAELNCGHYRIIDLPGVAQEELVHLMASVNDAEGNTIRRRSLSLDLAELRSPGWIGRTEATKAEIVAITRTRT